MHSTNSLILALSAAPAVQAWGTLGHETVAYVAQNFVSSATKAWAQDILGDTTTSYLANVATWADSYRETTAGKFSAPFHFIDAEDSPPSSCNVDYERDCGSSGCVVSAISNYTTRVTSTKLSATEVNYALRFLVHFIGDIHQPLHDEAYALGGNDVDVTYASKSTNLHAIWDTQMPEQLRGGYALTDAQKWATNLTTEINSGIYKSQKASWTTGIKLADPVGTSTTWATQANAYVCTVVAPKGWTSYESGDLSTNGYYKSAVSTIEVQIARAGVRLAAWLDAIVAADANAKRSYEGVAEEKRDLSGAQFLPEARELSKEKLARAAMGYGCKH